MKKITEKPNNFMEGLGYDFTSMFSSVFYMLLIFRKTNRRCKRRKKYCMIGKRDFKRNWKCPY